MDVQPQALDEDVFGDDEAVRNRDDDVRAEIEAAPESLRLVHRDAEPARRLLRGRRLEPPSAPGAGVRPGEHG